MTICIIPARGGSKRIPRKNIKEFCGKPMIQWSIEAARRANIFDHIIVSTDDDEIGEFAKSLDALVPFKRPQNLSNDHANTTDVIAHATEWAMNTGLNCEILCCLYATSPFVQTSDLVKAYNTIISQEWDFVFSAGEYSSSIFRSFKKISSGGVEMFFPEHSKTRSQDLPAALFDAGMFYMGTSNAWSKKLRIFDKNSFPIIIPSWRVQDIDTLEDWKRAESMASYILNL